MTSGHHLTRREGVDVLNPTTWGYRCPAIDATIVVEARPADQWGNRYVAELALADHLIATERFRTEDEAVARGGEWAEAAEAFAVTVEAPGGDPPSDGAT